MTILFIYLFFLREVLFEMFVDIDIPETQNFVLTAIAALQYECTQLSTVYHLHVQ